MNLMRDRLGALRQWLLARREAFTWGQCTWCGHWGELMPGETLCETCWLESK
jgi:hypothetical protein